LFGIIINLLLLILGPSLLMTFKLMVILNQMATILKIV